MTRIFCAISASKKTLRRTHDEWQQFKFIRERKIRFKIGVFGISKKGVKFLDFPVATLLPVKRLNFLTIYFEKKVSRSDAKKINAKKFFTKGLKTSGNSGNSGNNGVLTRGKVLPLWKH